MALGFLRRHRRWLYVFLWIVILGFIAFYIPMFTGVGQVGGEVLARVDDQVITTPEFQRAYFAQRQRLHTLYQGRLDDATLRRMGLEGQILEGLVAQRIIHLEARRLGLSVGDEAVARAIAGLPELNEDGRFVGAEEYRRRLELQGRDVRDFEESQRQQLLQQRLQALLTDGIGVTAAEAEEEFRRRNEQVRAEYVLVDAARFRSEATVADEEIRSRFEARKEDYRIPEKRIVSYVLVDTQALRSRVTLTDREIDAYYQANRDDFRRDEEACADHILVKVRQGSEGEGHPEAEARRLSEALLAKLRAGADFAELARASSEDKGSAPNGGDLGCFPRGRMVPEFDEVAFSLSVGETSELVKSPFGYHLIRVTSRREEVVAPLAEVKERIRQTLTADRAADLSDRTTEAISTALRGNARLDDVAREQGLAVQKSAAFTRGEVLDPLGPGAVSRAFDLKPGETDPDPHPGSRGPVFVSLTEVQPSRLPELGEVTDRVREDILEAKTADLARELAARLRARAAREGLEKAAEALKLVRKETPELVGRGQPLGDLGSSAALERVAYALPERELSDPVRLNEGWAVLRVLEKEPFDPAAFEAERGSLVASLRQEKRSRFFEAYLAEARGRYRVDRNPEAIRRVLGR